MNIYTYIYIYISETTPEELTNGRLHDGQSWLQEKLDTNLFGKKTASETAISG